MKRNTPEGALGEIALPTRPARRSGTTILLLLALTTLAMGAAPEASDPSTNTIAAALQLAAAPLIAALAGKYGWAVTVLVWVGALRFFVKPVVTLIEGYVHQTPSTKDDAVFAKVKGAAWFKWTIWALDWLGSIRPPNTTTNPLK